ncbi:MAG: 2-iminobutanoate/2-iminopropanoate deaminase [Gammaproteobacteria bacterium]|jgi:2-iminobutanoate/2-iminopropanoate deaminase
MLSADVPRVVWGGRLGLIGGLRPVERQQPQRALPESVEAQTRLILANLDAILVEQELARDNVISVQVQLTQFVRFQQRMLGAFAGHFAADANLAISCFGVTALPRDALVQMDIMITRPASAT